MPYTLNGIGTMYYGSREKGRDGSYVTTEWVTLWWIPLLPIRSFRVLEQGSSSHWFVIASHSSSSYLARRVPLNWAQVRNVYEVVALLVGGITALVMLV